MEAILLERPRVILNAGITLDGKIATKKSDSKISSSEDLRRVHRLRAEVDAVLVGSNTVMVDDPRLTVHKIPHKGKQPTRVVVDSGARINLNARVFNEEAKTIIAVSKKADSAKVREMMKKAEVVVCGEDRVDLRSLLQYLWDRGIRALLLEGGGNLNWSMLKEDLVDEVRVAVAPVVVGGRDATTLVEGEGFDLIKEGVKLRLKKCYELGEDLVLEYEVVR